MGAGWLGPIAIVVFFIVFSILNRWTVPWVARSVFERERQEGYFRFLHAHLRLQSEQAAFSRASVPEYCVADCSLRRLLAAQQTWTIRSTVLSFVTKSADYFGALLVYFALGAAIFGGLYPTTDVSELTTIISENSRVEDIEHEPIQQQKINPTDSGSCITDEYASDEGGGSGDGYVGGLHRQCLSAACIVIVVDACAPHLTEHHPADWQSALSKEEPRPALIRRYECLLFESSSDSWGLAECFMQHCQQAGLSDKMMMIT
ncbi:unnamed protein product [Schistocephalus solidus]|uniref:ABC transmembrane type-1 domain-containing protein n=1 Tax=Schistocephalus solidus TaxID=70667 RepID=A0A183SN77_SCHSO|nr:unnamed protein product [Schistocephalus solidus]